MTPPDPWPASFALLAACVPVLFGVAALRVSPAEPLRGASRAALAAVVLALVACVGGVWGPRGGGEGLPPALSALARGVRLDAVTGLMLALVCTIAVAIVRYSRAYLRGDPGQPRYARALLAALASVTLLVVSGNLAVIAIAWMGTSFALHHLLTFYRERPRALVAAHKKFLLSRLADVSLLGGVGLVGAVVGSLDLDAIDAWTRSHGALPPALQAAAVLFVVGVSLRSAQLPFHGWLTQVMEAPTPVSALLHAGVVNIGGFVLIRLAPLMAHAEVAQALLVVVGMTTAVVASLVMTTRVSVKVALAWSTCAQMGFMLVQCGLGLWHLALLHLVAHSLYKAHAFLGSGAVVEGWQAQQNAPRRGPASLGRVVGASVVLGGLGAAGAAAVGGPDPTLVPLALLLGLSLSPLVARGAGVGWRASAAIALRGAGAAALYFSWHAASARLLPTLPEPAAKPLSWLVVVGGFVLLFGAQALLHSRPEGRLARRLQPMLFAGFYLDEIFTRMTFLLWPPRLQPTPPAPPVGATIGVETLEARS